MKRRKTGIRTLVLAVALAASAAAVFPAVAGAVNVNVTTGPDGTLQVNVADLSGLENNVRIDVTPNGEIRVTDTAGITSQTIPPCIQDKPNSIRCPGALAMVIKVQLAVGDDILVVDEFLFAGHLFSVLAFLGPGDDIADGSDGDDEIDGEDGDDDIDAGDGNDMVKGGKGRDRGEGGKGNDWVYGGAHNDYLFGEQGRDWLFGGKGMHDKCNGGAQKDKQKGCEAGVRY